MAFSIQGNATSFSADFQQELIDYHVALNNKFHKSPKAFVEHAPFSSNEKVALRSWLDKKPATSLPLLKKQNHGFQFWHQGQRIVVKFKDRSTYVNNIKIPPMGNRNVMQRLQVLKAALAPLYKRKTEHALLAWLLPRAFAESESNVLYRNNRSWWQFFQDKHPINRVDTSQGNAWTQGAGRNMRGHIGTQRFGGIRLWWNKSKARWHAFVNNEKVVVALDTAHEYTIESAVMAADYLVGMYWHQLDKPETTRRMIQKNIERGWQESPAAASQ